MNREHIPRPAIVFRIRRWHYITGKASRSIDAHQGGLELVASKKEIRFVNALFPILALFVILVYGLIVQPVVLKQGGLSLEVIFMLATVISVCQLFRLGFTWNEIQSSMVHKLAQGLPAIFILFCIGIVIGSWIVSGTIPMLIYYGIRSVDPGHIYFIAFVIPIIFSTMTGTSWGSAGTIGVVIMGIAGVIGAKMPIVAGAVVGGAYFGDKLSPLSDTTNIAALATGVDLYDHVRSMMNTTIPSALIAGALYWWLGSVYPPATLAAGADMGAIDATLRAFENIFTFHWILLLPPAIVLYGSLTKKPTVPVLIASSLVSVIIALSIQRFSFGDVLSVLCKGFNVQMASWAPDLPTNVIGILNRGGLYNLIEAIVVCIIVFLYLGSIELINAIPTIVNRVFSFVRTRPAAITSALLSTALTNAMTSNQFVTSFVVGGAFAGKFDQLRIPRKVLSRSIEDMGTMLESMLPWTTTGIFMSTTLGVPVTEYNHWQLLSLINYGMALLLAWTGIGCFYGEVDGPAGQKPQDPS